MSRTHLTLTLGISDRYDFGWSGIHVMPIDNFTCLPKTEWKSLDWKRINLKFMACGIQSQIIHVILTRKAHLYFFENKFVQGCFGFGNEGLIDISNILWSWASIWFKCKEEKLSFYLCVQGEQIYDRRKANLWNKKWKPNSKQAIPLNWTFT